MRGGRQKRVNIRGHAHEEKRASSSVNWHTLRATDLGRGGVERAGEDKSVAHTSEEASADGP